jgi:RNA polymerase sigma factor for flagellar operon FliA
VARAHHARIRVALTVEPVQKKIALPLSISFAGSGRGGVSEMVLDGPAPGAPSPAVSPTAVPTPERLFHANLHVIEAVIRHVANRHRLAPDERDEFASDVRLRLIENDYEIVRRFEHRSSLRTYLATVIQRLFLDYRNKAWGKWRPSAEARRLGPIATRLERLITRDGLSFDEAVGVLQTNEGVTMSRDELHAIFDRLPMRTPKRFVGEQALDDLLAPAATTEDALVAREQAAAAARAQQALDRALARLPAQDQLIVRLRYADEMTIAQIARLMHLEQKPLYRRLARIREDLRAALEADGVTAPDVLGAGPEDDDGR